GWGGAGRPGLGNSGTRKSGGRGNSHRLSSNIESDSGEKAATAACCAADGAEMKRCWASFSKPRTAPAGATTQPRRQPVMQKYLEKLLMITTSPGSPRAVAGAPPDTSPP